LLVVAAAVIAACMPTTPPPSGGGGSTPPPPPPPAQGPTGGIDIHHPEAGITDPVAGMAVLETDCGPGDIDVNTATEDQLRTVLGIPRNDIDEVLIHRPWLRATDLLWLHSVPPTSRRALEERGCAEPTGLPPAAPMACEDGSDEVDLQSATLAEIMEGADLDRHEAKAFIAARPLPQDLFQLAGVKFAVSTGQLEELIEDEVVCVTPAPFEFRGTTYRWASGEHGAVVDSEADPAYALIVPPGAVDDPDGVWGRVTPDPESILPTADFHLHGDWLGTVGVRLPNAAEPGGRPGVLHEGADGVDRFSWGDGVVAEPGGTIVTAFSSLSEGTSLDVNSLCLGNPIFQAAGHDDGSIFCAADSVTDTALEVIARGRPGPINTYIAAQPHVGACSAVGRAYSTGDLPLSLSCGIEIDGTEATFTISNGSGVSIAGGIRRRSAWSRSVGTSRGPGSTSVIQRSTVACTGGSLGRSRRGSSRAPVWCYPAHQSRS
jgi:hypothetical protein